METVKEETSNLINHCRYTCILKGNLQEHPLQGYLVKHTNVIFHVSYYKIKIYSEVSMVVKESLDVNVNHGKQRGKFPFFLVSGEPHLTEGDSLSTQQFSSEYFAVPCRIVQGLLGTLKGSNY